MQRCKKCSKQFKWKTIVKSIFLGYKPIVCDGCGAKHYVQFRTRLIYATLISIPLLILISIQSIASISVSISLITKIFNFNRFFGIYIVLIYLFWGTVITCITPFFARYHIKSCEDDGTKVLLISNLNEVEADLTALILETYDIPFLKETKVSGCAVELYKGANCCGIDIYVQPDMLQMAKELIKPQNLDNN